MGGCVARWLVICIRMIESEKLLTSRTVEPICASEERISCSPILHARVWVGVCVCAFHRASINIFSLAKARARSTAATNATGARTRHADARRNARKIWDALCVCVSQHVVVSHTHEQLRRFALQCMCVDCGFECTRICVWNMCVCVCAYQTQ